MKQSPPSRQSLTQARTSAAATSDWAETGDFDRACLADAIMKLAEIDLRTGSRESVLEVNSIAALSEDRRDSPGLLRHAIPYGKVQLASKVRINIRY